MQMPSTCQLFLSPPTFKFVVSVAFVYVSCFGCIWLCFDIQVENRSIPRKFTLIHICKSHGIFSLYFCLLWSRTILLTENKIIDELKYLFFYCSCHSNSSNIKNNYCNNNKYILFMEFATEFCKFMQMTEVLIYLIKKDSFPK